MLHGPMVPDAVVVGEALQFRWSCLGRDFVEGYVASFAQTLHAHGLFVINGIGHIVWEDVPFNIVGLEPLMFNFLI